MIEGHGDDLYRYGNRIKYNFSTNIISNVNHSELYGYLSTVLARISSYPEPAPYSLERKVAQKLQIADDNVVVTNGATDAMYRIALLTRNEKSVIVIPTFREYQDACRLYAHNIEFVNRVEEIPADARCVWICNPNNPTGKVVAKGKLLSLAKNMPDSWIIVDQAYADYTELPVMAPKETVKTDNIILLSSLTKRFAVPGLRIGYIVASVAIAEAVRSVGIPWNVNTLAIEAGKYLIDHASDYVIPLRDLHNEALRITDAFKDMGIECTETDCNFLLCRLPRGASSDLKSYLIEEYGILVRDASNFENLDASYFRVAAQSREENDLLIFGIRKWLTDIR